MLLLRIFNLQGKNYENRLNSIVIDFFGYSTF